MAQCIAALAPVPARGGLPADAAVPGRAGPGRRQASFLPPSLPFRHFRVFLLPEGAFPDPALAKEPCSLWPPPWRPSARLVRRRLRRRAVRPRCGHGGRARCCPLPALETDIPEHLHPVPGAQQPAVPYSAGGTAGESRCFPWPQAPACGAASAFPASGSILPSAFCWLSSSAGSSSVEAGPWAETPGSSGSAPAPCRRTRRVHLPGRPSRRRLRSLCPLASP